MLLFSFYCMSFLIGSIPFGVIFSLWFCNKNPQEHGSKNIGMTNVWRIGGTQTALLTFVFDIGKGLFVMWVAEILQVSLDICAILVVMGHCYSAFLDFQGGKGLATSSGVILFLSPLSFFILFFCWLLTRQITRSSSKSAIVALVLLPILTYFCIIEHLIMILMLSTIVAYRHKDNFQRIRKNEELTL